MKKIYFSIALTMLFFNAFSQTVAEEQTALVVKKTATWCEPCGTWGWQLFDEIWDAVSNKSVILEMHDSPSSGLYSTAAAAFYSLHEPKGSTPVFYANTINRVQYVGTSINPNATRVNIINAVDSTNTKSPIVNSGFTKTISGTTLNVDTKVKFFQNTTGEYYLGIYVTEDHVSAYQKGIGVTTHRRIMRASFDTPIQGTLVSSGAVTAGTEFVSSRTLTLDPSWNTANIKVFTVIWEKVGSKFEYVNAHQVVGSASVDQFSADDLDIKLYPNVSSSDQDIMLEVNGASNQGVSIEVYNSVGKKINTIFKGKLKSNQESFNVNPSRSLSRGLYFVNIVSDNNSKKSIKLIVM